MKLIFVLSSLFIPSSHAYQFSNISFNLTSMEHLLVNNDQNSSATRHAPTSYKVTITRHSNDDQTNVTVFLREMPVDTTQIDEQNDTTSNQVETETQVRDATSFDDANEAVESELDKEDVEYAYFASDASVLRKMLVKLLMRQQNNRARHDDRFVRKNGLGKHPRIEELDSDEDLDTNSTEVGS